MLKHAAEPPSDQAVAEDMLTQPAASEVAEESRSSVPKDTSPAALRTLLENNLKWSQIIYEQNRKINNKLLWSAAANWLRLLVVVVPLIIAVWYLPTIIRGLQDKYGLFLNAAVKGQLPPASVSNLLDVLPINNVEREQLKAMLQSNKK